MFRPGSDLSDRYIFFNIPSLLPALLSETSPFPPPRLGLLDDGRNKNLAVASALPPLVTLLNDETDDVSLFFGFVIVFLTIGTIIGGDLMVAETDANCDIANGDGDLVGDI